MLKIYHPEGMVNYSNWMGPRKAVWSIEEADLLLLEGGADVCPEMYGEKIGSYVQYDKARDKREAALVAKAIKKGIPIWGTCRGSQFLSAMAGGKVIQHQDNPKFIHPMETIDGKKLLVSSTHHNAMNPYNLADNQYKILGWTKGISPFHLNGNDEESYEEETKEVEVCHFPELRAIGCQPHPEMLHTNNPDQYTPTLDWLRGLLNQLVNNEL